MTEPTQSVEVYTVPTDPARSSKPTTLSSPKSSEESKEQLSLAESPASDEADISPSSPTSQSASGVPSTAVNAVVSPHEELKGEATSKSAVASPLASPAKQPDPSPSSDPAPIHLPAASPQEDAPSSESKRVKTPKRSKTPKAAVAASTTPSASQTPRPPSKPSTPTASATRPSLTVTASQPPTARLSTIQASPLPSPSRVRTTEEILAFYGSPPPNAPLFLHLCSENRFDAILDALTAIPLYSRTRHISQVDSHGNTALFYSLAPTHSSLLTLLLDYGADVNHANNQRNSALHLAVHFQYKKAILTLIDHGANIRVENWEHQQPHQILKSNDKIQQAQAQLNAAYEAYQERVKGQGSGGGGDVMGMEREMKGYYRGMFDVMDVERLGVLTWGNVENMMRIMLKDREEKKERENPRPIIRLTAADREKERLAGGGGGSGGGTGGMAGVDYVMEWFKSMDVDANGVISFHEFLNAVMAWKSEMEKEEKKGKKKRAK